MRVVRKNSGRREGEREREREEEREKHRKSVVLSEISFLRDN